MTSEVTGKKKEAEEETRDHKTSGEIRRKEAQERK